MIAARYFDINQAAEYTCYAPQSIYDYAARRMIPFLKAGGRNLFRVSELDLWLNSGADYAAATKIIISRKYREEDANMNMSAEEIAQYLHLEASTIYRLKFEERIPYVKMRKKLLFRTAEIDKWLDYGGTYEMALMIMSERKVIV
jgi:excisionase family DNA binding protein